VDGDGGEPAAEGLASGNFDEVADEVRKMIAQGFVDGLVRRYEARFVAYAPHVEDVVYDQVEQVVRRSKEERIEDPRRLLVWLVRRRILDLLKRPPGRYGYEAEEGEDWDTPEVVAERSALFRAVKELVARWPNRRMRILTELFLDAGFHGEQLSMLDAQTIMREQYGEDMTYDNVKRTVNRGWGRLAAEASEIVQDFEEDEEAEQGER